MRRCTMDDARNEPRTLAEAHQELGRLRTALAQSLERERVTAEVLGIMAHSPTDAQPVLDAIAESAARVCDASDATLRLLERGSLRRAARFGEMSNRPN